MISTFVKHFGRVSTPQLAKLNKTVSIDIIGGTDIGNNNNNISDPDVNPDEDSGAEKAKEKEKEEVENIRKLSLMIRDLSKYTILMGVAMLSSFIVTIFVVLTGVYSDNINIITLSTNFVIMDSVTNIICLYLQFHFNRRYYKKLCNKLNQICESRYTHEINAQLVKSTSTDNSYLQLTKIDRQGTIGIERKQDGIHDEKEDKTTDMNAADENEPPKALADMRQFSHENLQ